jgi:hypothetical protein
LRFHNWERNLGSLGASEEPFGEGVEGAEDAHGQSLKATLDEGADLVDLPGQGTL